MNDFTQSNTKTKQIPDIAIIQPVAKPRVNFPLITLGIIFPNGAIKPSRPMVAAMCIPILSLHSLKEIAEAISKTKPTTEGINAVILLGSPPK